MEKMILSFIDSGLTVLHVLVRKDMDVHEHERQCNITLRHELK